MPLDVVDLFEKAPNLKVDIVCLMLVIVLKESVFTSCVFEGLDVHGITAKANAFRSPNARVRAYVDMLRPRLKGACMEVPKDPRYHIQVSQMAAQGVGRYTGSCWIMKVLGIVEKCVDGERSGKRRKRDAPAPSANATSEADAESLGAGVETGLLVAVGNTSNYKLLDHESEDLAEFVRDCLSCETEWQQALVSDDFEFVASTIASIVEKSKIAQRCMIPAPKKLDSYVAGFVSRKLFLVCWLFGGLKGLDWEKVERRRMVDLLPDMTDQLDHFPPGWKVAEISCFLLGRPDRFPFTTMWPCVFHKCVAEKHEKEALRWVRSGQYVQKACELRDSTRVEHHPKHIFQGLLQEHGPNSSTPGSSSRTGSAKKR